MVGLNQHTRTKHINNLSINPTLQPDNHLQPGNHYTDQQQNNFTDPLPPSTNPWRSQVCGESFHSFQELKQHKIHIHSGHPSSRDKYNRTPLHLAAAAGYMHCVRYLLQNYDKRMIHALDADGKTAMDYASNEQCRKDIEIRMLAR